MTMAPPPEGMTPQPKEHQTRTSPEVRSEILAMFKRANPKYARPFEKGDRLSRASILGTEDWSSYGQVILQMAILDTLLSIEEKLTGGTQEH
jgi:hypothetical protein